MFSQGFNDHFNTRSIRRHPFRRIDRNSLCPKSTPKRISDETAEAESDLGPRPQDVYARPRTLPSPSLRRNSRWCEYWAGKGKYEELGLRVLWVEPIPKVFDELKSNISQLPRQRAIQALVTDRAYETYQFHVANNHGASSSILELKDHKDIWPYVECTETISLAGTTLTSLVQEQ